MILCINAQAASSGDLAQGFIQLGVASPRQADLKLLKLLCNRVPKLIGYWAWNSGLLALQEFPELRGRIVELPEPLGAWLN
jgi:hypothetical protein